MLVYADVLFYIQPASALASTDAYLSGSSDFDPRSYLGRGLNSSNKMPNFLNQNSSVHLTSVSNPFLPDMGDAHRSQSIGLSVLQRPLPNTLQVTSAGDIVNNFGQSDDISRSIGSSYGDNERGGRLLFPTRGHLMIPSIVAENVDDNKPINSEVRKYFQRSCVSEHDTSYLSDSELGSLAKGLGTESSSPVGRTKSISPISEQNQPSRSPDLYSGQLQFRRSAPPLPHSTNNSASNEPIDMLFSIDSTAHSPFSTDGSAVRRLQYSDSWGGGGDNSASPDRELYLQQQKKLIVPSSGSGEGLSQRSPLSLRIGSQGDAWENQQPTITSAAVHRALTDYNQAPPVMLQTSFAGLNLPTSFSMRDDSDRFQSLTTSAQSKSSFKAF